MKEVLIQFNEWLMYYIGFRNFFYFPLLELVVILLFFRKNFWEATIWVFGIINLIFLWVFFAPLSYGTILTPRTDRILLELLFVTFPLIIAFIAAIVYFVIKKFSSQRPPPYQKLIAILTLFFSMLGFLFVWILLESRWDNVNISKDNVNISKDNMNTPKIDICQYGSKSFGQLEELLKKRIVGSKNSDLKSFFQNTPSTKQKSGEIKPKPRSGRIARIPWGKIHQIIYRCPLPDNNNNRWGIAIIEDIVGMVTYLDLYLFYDDENFVRRNEPFDADRVGKSDVFAKAILSRNQIQHYDRKSLREEMTADGFLRHRSCAYDQKVMDIYSTHPPPPDTIEALLGTYFYPYSLPSATVIFAAKDGRFLSATAADLKRCRLSIEMQSRQSAAWMINNYPNSWISKELLKRKLERERQDKLRKKKAREKTRGK